MTHHAQVLTGLQALALGPCLGQVRVRVQGSSPAAGRVRGRRERQVPVLGPCLGQVQARVQGSWPVADLQAERRGVTCWDPTISCQLSYVTTT